MKLGMHAGPQDCSYEDLRRVWRLADSSGIHWVSVWDHFYGSTDFKAPTFETLSIMAALAAETTNVRVGCLVFGMAYRHPAVLAKGAATIDHVSNGRLSLGLGAGWHEHEHNSFGIPFRPLKDRMDAFEEGVHIIKSMLTRETTTFDGKHFQVKDAHSFPRPVQTPPSIWIGGMGERRTLRIAARYGDGWNGGNVSPELYKGKLEVLDRWCEVEGRDPAQVERSINTGFFMGADQADADRERRRFEERWGPRATPERTMETLTGGMLFGTPAEVIDRIAAYEDAGAQGLNLNMNAPFNFDALQAFCEEVVPAFA